MQRLTGSLGPGTVGAPATVADLAPLDREALLELLTQQQRFALAGRWSSGLADALSDHLHYVLGVSWLARESEDPAEWAAALECVHTRCREAAETVRSIVDFVRRRDDVRDGTFRLSSVVEQAMRLVEPLAHTSRVAVDCTTEGGAVIGDERRLVEQVVVNLLSNAIRACAESGGSVHVTATTPAAGRARIVVRDTGPGIPPEVRSSMFRPVATSHGASDGSGLGLFLVRRIVLDLGGTIRTSTSSKGTCFLIDLPAAVSTPSADHPA